MQKIVNEDREEKSHRRSARVATIQTSKKPKQKQGIVNAPGKPKKAPWEESDFMQKQDVLSDAIANHFGHNEKTGSKIQDRRYSSLVYEDESKLSSAESSINNVDQGTHAEKFTDYVATTKV